MVATIGARFVALFLAVSLCALTSCQRPSGAPHDHGHHRAHGGGSDSEAVERGPHGGRLVRSGSFSLELTIFETGVPPQFRIYAYSDGVIVSPSDVRVSVVAKRLEGREDRFSFTPVHDFLVSDREVTEPHSFDVAVVAHYKGQEYSWNYGTYEGRTTIPEGVATRSGIASERAQPRVIHTTTRVRGKITPSEHRIAHVIPRFSGVVREGRKHIGDRVERGEVLAIIESNQSLQPFEVRSQISGTVINGHVIVGEFVPENQWIYIIADISEVWADFFVPLREKLEVQPGQSLTFAPVDGQPVVEGVVSYSAPYADERSQSQLVRAVVPNPHQQLLPGMFVVGDLVISTREAPVAVRRSALQSMRGWQVVFIKHAEVYEARPVELGVSDSVWVEVVAGLAAGDEYVTENSFLIKADILKSGATHDH